MPFPLVNKKQGFTLIEVLIVVTIIAILGVALTLSLRGQRLKADDSHTKSDLSRLKIAFENYYNDHNCYPPADWFDSVDDCSSTHLLPYLSAIPCDRQTGLPFVLETDETGCVWFKLYATLLSPNTDEQAIAQRSSTGSPKGNYGVSSTNTNVFVYYDASSPVPSPTPPPTPTPIPLPSSIFYYCSSLGNCTTRPPNLTCNPSFTGDPYCGNPESPCRDVVSSCQ